MTLLTDSHCHLDFPDFKEDLERVLVRAVNADVGLMLTICTRVSQFDQVLHLAEKYDHVFCSVGIHPHNVSSEPEMTAQQLIYMAEHPKVIGFGETGLDYHYTYSSRTIQKRCFLAHIIAARQTGLPIIIHTRDADEDMMEILDKEQKKGAFPGLIHCFSSGADLARKALDYGFYISISGIITFKKTDKLRQTITDIPTSRLLVETDSPYLAPSPNRGKRNEPAFVIHTAAALAELKEMSYSDLAEETTANFLYLFDKAKSWLDAREIKIQEIRTTT